MNMIFRKLKSTKGFALVTVFLVVSVLLIFAGVFVNQSVSQNNTANIFKRQTQALNAADAGLDHAFRWLTMQAEGGSFPITTQVNPWNGGNPQTLSGVSYSVVIERVNIPSSPSTFRYSVTSTGTSGNTTRILRKYVQAINFANYIWFTNRETWGGSNVWFISVDNLDGLVHTNTHFNIYGDPTFNGEVSSVDEYIRFYNNGNNVNLAALQSTYDSPSFNDGYNFGAEQAIMPGTAQDLKTNALSGGRVFNNNTTVVLTSDGQMDYKVGNGSWQYDKPLPANGALFVNGTLTISGTLNGRLTVGASQDVKIADNLVYAAGDPVTNPSGDDTLGIISEGDVVIKNNAPSNLSIHGCIMALSNSFYLDDWNSVSKGTLSVRGGIIQKERGPVGTFNAASGQKISGYTKDYKYDDRLLSSPPPFMPTTGSYVTLSWEDIQG
jgi:type II secretory pathway pseudopilin PulG